MTFIFDKSCRNTHLLVGRGRTSEHRMTYLFPAEMWRYFALEISTCEVLEAVSGEFFRPVVGRVLDSR